MCIVFEGKKSQMFRHQRYDGWGFKDDKLMESDLRRMQQEVAVWPPKLDIGLHVS